MLSRFSKMIQAERDSHTLLHHHCRIKQKIIIAYNIQATEIKIPVHYGGGRGNSVSLAGYNQRYPRHIFHTDAFFLCQRMAVLHQEPDGIEKRKHQCVIFPHIKGLKHQAEIQQALIQLLRDIVCVRTVQIEMDSRVFMLQRD